MKPFGYIRLFEGWFTFEWGESIKLMGRRAVLWFGDLQFLVVNEPSHWPAPHHSKFQIAWTGDSWWRIEVFKGQGQGRRG